jgi:hypothetical protein
VLGDEFYRQVVMEVGDEHWGGVGDGHQD